MKKSKQLTLPSGATCAVRKLAAYDFIELGNIPTPLLVETTKKKLESNDFPKISKEDLAFGVALARLALTRACSPLRSATGGEFIIVDKPFHKCAANEISIEELEQADADMIVAEVTALSKMAKEAADKAKPFPEKQEVAS